MSLLYRCLIYFFPVPLGVIEWVIRTGMRDSDAAVFFGPALCSAALALLLPILVPKSLRGGSSKTAEQILLALPHYSLRSKRDERLVAIGLIVLIAGIAAWGACLYLGISKTGWIRLGAREYDIKFWIGGTLYFIVIVLTELKERT